MKTERVTDYQQLLNKRDQLMTQPVNAGANTRPAGQLGHRHDTLETILKKHTHGLIIATILTGWLGLSLSLLDVLLKLKLPIFLASLFSFGIVSIIIGSVCDSLNFDQITSTIMKPKRRLNTNRQLYPDRFGPQITDLLNLLATLQALSDQHPFSSNLRQQPLKHLVADDVTPEYVDYNLIKWGDSINDHQTITKTNRAGFQQTWYNAIVDDGTEFLFSTVRQAYLTPETTEIVCKDGSRSKPIDLNLKLMLQLTLLLNDCLNTAVPIQAPAVPNMIDPLLNETAFINAIADLNVALTKPTLATHFWLAESDQLTAAKARLITTITTTRLELHNYIVKYKDNLLKQEQLKIQQTKLLRDAELLNAFSSKQINNFDKGDVSIAPDQKKNLDC